MDKVDRTNEGNTCGAMATNDRVDQIIDWLTAHDKDTKDFEDAFADHDNWMATHDERKVAVKAAAQRLGILPPPIEQVLEAGLLVKRDSKGVDCYCKKNGEYVLCTRIYLPMARYEEFGIYACSGERDGTPAFHDIPVYCGGPDIHYCTD